MDAAGKKSAEVNDAANTNMINKDAADKSMADKNAADKNMTDKNTTDQNWDEEGVAAGRFESFRQVVAALRGENGCPWDKAQTFESLKPCMINEMTEAIGAINIYGEERDPENLCEELGDVLLQVVLLAQIAEEEGLFQIEDVIRGISRKMIRRHPHVFPTPEALELEAELKRKADQEAQNPEEERKPKSAPESEVMQNPGQKTENTPAVQLTVGEVPGRWEAIKQAEKKNKAPGQKQKEKEAFVAAAGEVIRHLEEKAK